MSNHRKIEFSPFRESFETRKNSFRPHIELFKDYSIDLFEVTVTEVRLRKVNNFQELNVRNPFVLLTATSVHHCPRSGSAAIFSADDCLSGTVPHFTSLVVNQLLSEPVEPSRDRRISIGATARSRIYARLPRKRRSLFRARSCLGSFVCAPPILVHGGGCLSRNHDADHLVDTRIERAVPRTSQEKSVLCFRWHTVPSA